MPRAEFAAQFSFVLPRYTLSWAYIETNENKSLSSNDRKGGGGGGGGDPLQPICNLIRIPFLHRFVPRKITPLEFQIAFIFDKSQDQHIKKPKTQPA